MAKHSNGIVRDGRKPGWFYIDGALISRYGSTIGAYGIAVYAGLAYVAAEHKSDRAIIGYDALAALLGIGRNTVIRTLRDLGKAGVITIEPQTDESGNPIGANIYTLCAITEHKAIERQGGVPTQGTGYPHRVPSIPTQGTGYPERDGGVPTQVYDMIPLVHDHDSPPPPTRVEAKNGGGGVDDRTLAFLTDEAIGAAEDFAHLPYEAVYADYTARRADSQSKGAIVKAWRLKPPSLDRPYRAPRSNGTSGPIYTTKPNMPETAVSPSEVLRLAKERR